MILNMLKHWLTARDGESFSLTKLAFIAAMLAMTYRFVGEMTPDYAAYAGGVAALIAAMAAKYYVETPEKK